MNTRKKNRVFFVLASVFLSNALLAELIGTKIFSLEQTLGLPFAQIPLFSHHTLDFNLTAGVLIWPVVFIITDIMNEYFGRKGVRHISILTACIIVYAFFIIYISMQLAPAPFWQKLHAQDPSGNAFDINFAFKLLFGQGLGIIIGSLAAFLIGQMLDVFVFQRLRRITGEKRLWLRATGSTLVSQLIDSFVVLFLAFYLLAPAGKAFSLSMLFSIATLNYMYKLLVAILLTPVIYLNRWCIDKYLGAKLSQAMKIEAANNSHRFF